MHITDIPTPAVLVDLDVMERNIQNAAALAQKSGKQFCPMTKTHKSAEIARMQLAAGANGLLVGTLAEAETFASFAPLILFPYPIVGPANLARLGAIASRTEIILALDSMDAAEGYQQTFAQHAAPIRYTLIVDVGLHRLGISPEAAVPLVQEIATRCPALCFAGISTHPGQIYGCASKEDTLRIAREEHTIFQAAGTALAQAGFPCDIIATGSTPTFQHELALPAFTMLRPGNYVFNDLQQVLLGAAEESDCALFALCTIIAHPAPDLFIMDGGGKCLALDRGAHGNAAFTGYGRVLGHPEATVESLSEEVGKLRIFGETTLRVGSRIRILPNHSCPVANLTSYLIGVRGDTVERLIEVNARSNAQPPDIACVCM